MVHTEDAGSVVVWTIDRPRQRNALDLATMRALTTAIRTAAAAGDHRAAILTAAGDIFVSGGDLKELRDRHTPADAEELTDVGATLTAAIAACPFPVLCALDGPAIGGGAELAVACDLRIAHPRAWIAFRQVRMGVTTSWDTVPRLVGLVGAGTAARLLYTGHDLTAEDAHRAGLYDALDEDPRALARRWADDIAAGAPSAVAAMKELVRAATAMPSVRALERERFLARWTSGDHEEATEAYFAKRPARFRARSK